uniref:Calmodulin-binding heat-shock protein n=1 Tax=Kalanchoe fedtschenkoi TaxID=63787 RepID=A0A7N0UHU5_KALFE
MSIACGLPLLECVYCLACTRWAWKRCLHTAGHDSENWPEATPEEFEPVPRLCRYILAVYEDDLRDPVCAPPGGYAIDPDCVITKKNYRDTQGLNLGSQSDYKTLLDNKPGQRKFDGGYVHNGLLKAAGCVLDTECDTLRELVEKYPNYTLTFTGHSLGSGVAALLTIVVIRNNQRLANIDRRRIRCYAIAPARCMSLNLAVRYADVINSIVLQDDFLPRTATPLQDIFKSLFCLPCLLCMRCMRDTCVPEERLLKDPRRLYAPGRCYHIVERKPFRIGRYPPVVRTAVPVDGRFEHIVLSCNATSDHALLWIEREAQRALNKIQTMEIPPTQKMERQQTLAKEHNEEHKAALRRAITLNIPHAYSPAGDEPQDDYMSESAHANLESSSSVGSTRRSKKLSGNWEDLIERLFDKDDHGQLLIKENLR